jgi:hypothetical protein
MAAMIIMVAPAARGGRQRHRCSWRSQRGPNRPKRIDDAINAGRHVRSMTRRASESTDPPDRVSGRTDRAREPEEVCLLVLALTGRLFRPEPTAGFVRVAEGCSAQSRRLPFRVRVLDSLGPRHVRSHSGVRRSWSDDECVHRAVDERRAVDEHGAVD